MEFNGKFFIIDTTMQGGYFGLAESIGLKRELLFQFACTKAHDTGRSLVSFVEMMKDLVDISSLNAVVISVGPGSFTGIKIGVGFVQGLALGNAFRDMQIMSASSLDSISRMNSGIWALKSTRRKGFLSIDGETQVVDLSDPSLQNFVDDLGGDVSILGEWKEFENALGGKSKNLSHDEVGPLTLRSMMNDLQSCQKISDGLLIPNYVRRSAPEEKQLERD